MNIKLSISLLASNRLGSLKRCLESLKPLLRKVPSELIVVFTGTDENVRALAESYTEEVVTFAWCDDFSAARNAALERAKGEWFLWIDDDEWFDDVTEICDFFQTGDYKNYASAYYVVRNYDDWNAMSYSDFHAYRMTKIFPQSRFEKPVHEEMLPQVEPAKYFHVFVHHYGYIKDVKNQNRKMSRNLPLLLAGSGEESNGYTGLSADCERILYGRTMERGGKLVQKRICALSEDRGVSENALVSHLSVIDSVRKIRPDMCAGRNSGYSGKRNFGQEENM